MLKLKSIVVFLLVFVLGGLFIGCENLMSALTHQDWEDTHSSAEINPEDLIVIVKQKQARFVKLSYSDYNCFTWIELERFQKDKIPEKIAAQLRVNKRFLNLVKVIKKMPADSRQTLLDRAVKTYKPTWAELGKIDPSGQTDAGQEAEQAIARAIVGLVKELFESSDKE